MLLHRYAPNARRGFFYPYPSPPPVQSPPPFLGSAAKSGKWLEQARQVMATAEHMRPYIEQYGPMIKNLPQMWKLYRAVNSMPDPDSPEEKKIEPLKAEAPKKELLDKEKVKKEPIRTAESVPWFPGRYS